MEDSPTTPSPTITSTRTATSTFVPNTETPTVTAAPTQPLPTIVIATPVDTGVNVEVKCAEILGTPLEGSLGKGVLVTNTFGSGYSLWNLETGENRSLDLDRSLTSRNAAVSPNGSMLALEKFDQNSHHQVWILDAGGQILKTLDGDYLQSTNPAWSWLNDRQMIFNTTFLQPETSGQKSPPTFLVLDPMNGEQQSLVADFPNLLDWTGPAAAWDSPWDQSRVAYNSSLSHAVYLGEGTIEYSLWDLARGKETASLLALQDHTGPPRWSPDGSQFLMLGFKGDPANLPAQFDYHLYLVDTKGKMTALDQGLKWNYDGYFWSPSGRYIALFLYQENGMDRLVLFDTQARKFTDYCINFTPYGSFITDPPVWSPDESKLILEDRVPEGSGFPRLILVDLVQGTAAQIAADTEIQGWMSGTH